jgi:hypothetical protein
MRLNLWLLAYWTAAMVNSTFDVYLEGPQGAIWFWSVFGFGLAALHYQTSEAPSWRASPVSQHSIPRLPFPESG